MYTVEISRQFSSAHKLRGYQGKCEALHGHNWKVEIAVTAKELDHLGMVVDFKILKKVADEILDQYDHKYINEVAPFDTLNPSSENIAQVLFDQFAARIDDDRVKLQSISVWESEGNKATYVKQ